MKNFQIKIIVFLTFLSYGSVLYSQQNELLNQINYAKKLFVEEKYFDAITEFKRLLFFSDSVYQFEANFYIGKSYKAGAKLNEAIRYFTFAEIYAETKEQVYQSKIEIIRANILRKTIRRALQLLDDIENDFLYSDKINEINYWRGWAFIFDDKWEDAANSFAKISEDHKLVKLCKNVTDEKYSVSTAKILSYIIPGSGQFYTGEYISGLLSFGWNVLCGYITINSFIDDRIFDGLAVANFLWLRFYIGNLQNAEKFAVEKNLHITNEALLYLQYEYNGIKP